MNHPNSDKRGRHRDAASLSAPCPEYYLVRLLPISMTNRHGSGDDAASAPSLHGETPISVVDSLQSHRQLHWGISVAVTSDEFLGTCNEQGVPWDGGVRGSGAPAYLIDLFRSQLVANCRLVALP